MKNLGCNAKVFTDREGIIKLQNYENQYSCRWEIKGMYLKRISLILSTR